MKNIKLIIEYEGTNYHGWQSQINALTVQDIIKAAITKLTDETCNLIGSSRTDVGVHAFGQVANFITESSIPGVKFSYALNSFLPKDIVIKKSEEVELDFHSRYWALGKKYKYLILNASHPSALLRNYGYHAKSVLNFEDMQQAAGYFLGRHDFSAFKSTGSDVKSNERTITGVSLEKKDELIEFQISGDGFLYNMVRIIVGTLIEVGQGKLKGSDIPGIIQSKDRKRAGKTAPAHGLYLVEVYYN
jgi:tRNA pseudouridine38-40 synthase